MAKKIQHLRGTYEEYKNANITPLEGEIALEEGENGFIRIKIGDGKTPYLALPYLFGRIVHCTPQSDGKLSLVLRHGDEYRAEAITSLSLSLPEEIRDDYHSCVIFDTGLTPPTISYPKELVFYGDACEGGLFIPEKRTRYQIVVKNHTGAIYGRVSGVSHDLAYQSYYEVAEEILPNLAAIKVTNPDRLLDIALCGYLGYPNSDGYFEGAGDYNSTYKKFLIKLICQNGCIVDYDEFLSCAKNAGTYIVNKIDLVEEEGGFSYLANTTTSFAMATNGKHPLAEGFSYRLRARILLQNNDSAFTVGQVMNSPFTAFYGIESKKIPMTYLGEGAFEIDFTSDKSKKLTKINSSGIGKTGRLFFAEDSLTLVACKDDYEGEMKRMRTELSLYIDTPLYAMEYSVDTLSLASQTITRYIEASILEDFTLYSTYGEYPVFKKDLPSPMNPDLYGTMPNFTEAYSTYDLEYMPASFYFDPYEGNGVLYFSGEQGITSVEEMKDWIESNYGTIGYAYPKATPTVEQISCSTPLVPYKGYTFLMQEGGEEGSFIVTYYTSEEENGEY